MLHMSAHTQRGKGEGEGHALARGLCMREKEVGVCEGETWMVWVPGREGGGGGGREDCGEGRGERQPDKEKVIERKRGRVGMRG